MAREEETVEGWKFICEGRLCMALVLEKWGEEEEKITNGGGRCLTAFYDRLVLTRKCTSVRCSN